MKPFIFVACIVSVAGCSSSDNTPAPVLAQDFVTDVNPKTIKQTNLFTNHPENNTTETSTLVYENGRIKEIDFVDDDGTSGAIKVTRDNIGNAIKSETYFNKGGTLTEDSYLDYTYSKGLLTSMKKYYWYNNAFTNLENTTFTYNDKNQLTEMKVVNGSGKVQRLCTYTYSDDSTNPSAVSSSFPSASTPFSFTNSYAYENSTSALIAYFQIRGFIDQALIKKNVSTITNVTNEGPAPVQDLSISYTYTDGNIPLKSVQTDATGSETWEFGY